MHDYSIIIKSEMDKTSVRINVGLEEQFMQLSRFCNLDRDASTVLVIDRTFDLSSMFATVTVFKQLDLLRGKSNDHPIMLGPILLSSDATEETNRYFLTQLKWKLQNIELRGVMFNDEKFVLGSDQEKALISAMKSLFPEATRFFCVYHISKIFEKNCETLGYL